MKKIYSRPLAPATIKPESQREVWINQYTTSSNDVDCLLQAFEKIEFLQEIISSLEQQLIETQQQLLATEEELLYTNNALCSALLPPEHLTFNEARELSKKLLANNTCASSCLAILLGAIYSCPVEARDLEPKASQESKNIQVAKKSRCR